MRKSEKESYKMTKTLKKILQNKRRKDTEKQWKEEVMKIAS